MMKISDPVMYGHAISTYYKDVFEKHASIFKDLKVNCDNGLQNVYTKIETLGEEKQKEIISDIENVYTYNPKLAMVDSSKGITNFHSPSNIIIDASMPVVMRDSGKMWGPDNKLKEVNCMIPDRS
jgi:isocitrate dehydrogenase